MVASSCASLAVYWEVVLCVFALAACERRQGADSGHSHVVSVPSASVAAPEASARPVASPAARSDSSKAAEEDVRKADEAYAAGDRDKAKEYYEKAAQEGSAEAHFALGYKYALPDKQGLSHFIEAAEQGHAQALDYALDALLFGAESLRNANPERALELYETAKKANPALTFYDEKGRADTLRKCAEPKGFDAEAFMHEYGITDNDKGFGYGVWELAEEASTGGRFGKPNPWLVLNLICRGSSVPAELEAAVVDAYANWKRGIAKRFDLCMYITSGYGQGYCADREAKEAAEKRDAAEKALVGGWPSQHRAAFDKLKKAADAYFEAVTEHEVDLSGTARAAFQEEAEVQLRDAFQKAVAQCESGKLPTSSPAASRIANAELKKLYTRIMGTPDLERGTISRKGIDQVQRKWRTYADAWVEFGRIRYPKVAENAWRTWLTQQRVAQLKSFVD